jgi:hypothetical protein
LTLTSSISGVAVLLLVPKLSVIISGVVVLLTMAGLSVLLSGVAVVLIMAGSSDWKAYVKIKYDDGARY